MKVVSRKVGCALALVLGLAGCSDDPAPASSMRAGAQATVSAGGAGPGAGGGAASQARWFGPEQVARGAQVYASNCAGCHGDSAQGTFNWRKPDASGKYPPPPLDGTAHTWHHPIRVLGAQIKFGAPGGQGMMPGFAQTLSDEQVLEVIAWFQSNWPDDIYAAWVDIEKRSRAAAQ